MFLLCKKKGKKKSVKYRNHNIDLLKVIVKDFIKFAAKTWYKVPKEQQVSMNIFRKPTLLLTDVSMTIHVEHKIVYEEIRSRCKQDSKIFYRDKLIDIKWFSLAEQLLYTRIIRKDANGIFRLYSYDNQEYSNKGKEVAYVITLGEKLVTHAHIFRDHNEGKTYFHSTLNAGKPVICAGSLKVSNGIIVYIDNKSGHYSPGIGNLYNAVKLLNEVMHLNCIIYTIGFTIDKATGKSHIACRTRIKGSFLADMESVGEDGLTTPARYFAMMKKSDDDYKKIIDDTLVESKRRIAR